jgi:hypothetical protein
MRLVVSAILRYILLLKCGYLFTIRPSDPIGFGCQNGLLQPITPSVVLCRYSVAQTAGTIQEGFHHDHRESAHAVTGGSLQDFPLFGAGRNAMLAC